MKTLIVYYSFEGSTEYFANALAKKLDADILSLKPVKELKSKGFSKFIWGGMQAVMKKKPLLENYSFDSSNYDTIIFGTPIWANSFAPPLATFFAKESLSGKNLALFYCFEGGVGNIEETFKNLYPTNNFIGITGLMTRKTVKEENKVMLFEWIDGCLAK